MTAPVGILLAAGRGSRFGTHKLLHPLADGRPLGEASARAMRLALPRVIAVLRAGDSDLEAVFRAAGVETVAFAGAGEGMGASLAFAVGATADAGGWVVGLADMPYVKPRTIRAVADALEAGASIVAPFLPDGRRGHPVGFAAEWRMGLAALAGDVGARGLLRNNQHKIKAIEEVDPGCVIDVDLPEDLLGAGPSNHGTGF